MLEFGHLFQDQKKETDQYKTQEMCNEDPSSLWNIPDKFKTQEIREKSLEQASWQLENVPDYFKTQGMCIEAVEDEPHPLLYVPDHFKTQGMCIEAVEKYPLLLAWVPDHFKTQEMWTKPLKKRHGCRAMFLIFLRSRKCAMG